MPTFDHLMKGEQKVCLFLAQLFVQIPVHYLAHQMDLQMCTYMGTQIIYIYMYPLIATDVYIYGHTNHHVYMYLLIAQQRQRTSYTQKVKT